MTIDHWCPKMLRETLCTQEAHIPRGELEQWTRTAFNELLLVLELHRPVAPNGKHGNLHTATCGCEDL